MSLTRPRWSGRFMEISRIDTTPKAEAIGRGGRLPAFRRRAPAGAGEGFSLHVQAAADSAASSSSATMLVILIIGFTAGPAVSLYGSPTVSPVTAALCASLPLPP